MFGAQFQLTHLTLHLFTYFSAPCNTRLQLWSHLLVVCLKEPRSLPGCIPYQGAFPTWVHSLPGCVPYHRVPYQDAGALPGALPGCIPYLGAFPTGVHSLPLGACHLGAFPTRVRSLPGCIPYQGAFLTTECPTRMRVPEQDVGALLGALPGCIPYQGAFPTRVHSLPGCIPYHRVHSLPPSAFPTGVHSYHWVPYQDAFPTRVHFLPEYSPCYSVLRCPDLLRQLNSPTRVAIDRA